MLNVSKMSFSSVFLFFFVVVSFIYCFFHDTLDIHTHLNIPKEHIVRYDKKSNDELVAEVCKFTKDSLVYPSFLSFCFSLFFSDFPFHFFSC